MLLLAGHAAGLYPGAAVRVPVRPEYERGAGVQRQGPGPRHLPRYQGRSEG